MSDEDFHVSPKSDAEIERLALDLRVELRALNDSKLDLIEFIARAERSNDERLRGVKLFPVADAEMGGAEAYVDFNPPCIFARMSVYGELKKGGARARMTIAHEIGHLLMHPGARKARMAQGNATKEYIPPVNSAERQARVFAAALLMPAALVRRCQTADNLRLLCGVSAEAARIRFEVVQKKQAAHKTPKDILEAIENQKSIEAAGFTRRAPRSVLRPVLAKMLAWETAPEHPGHDPNEFRCVDGRYVIRQSRYEQSRPGGWRLANGMIIPWEAELSGWN